MVGSTRRKHGGLEWTSPTFVVPEKDSRIRIVSDFREVNMLIKRKPYTMPRTHYAEEEWIYTLHEDGFEHAVLLL